MSSRGLLRLVHLAFLAVVGGVCLLAPARARAQYASLSGWCQTGKVQTLTSGIPSTPPPLGAYVQGSYPGCTVTIYYAGTTNLVPGADIFSDASGTVLGNPFTASSSTGLWTFYVNQTLAATQGANSIFDVKLSGTLPAPVTLPYVAVQGNSTSPFLVNATLSGATTNTGTITGGAVNPATASVGALTVTSPAITPTSIEQIAYSDLYKFSGVSGLPALSAGVQAVLAPWTVVPYGVMSGGVSIVSTSSSSPTVTWIAGDKFNPLWSPGKRVNLDATALTISTCASATSCTLSGNAPRTTSYGWMVTGYPTPVYISGGVGGSETTDIAGIGAECPAGGATSICFTPTVSHSGSYTMQSATAGTQEAINAIEATGGGHVVIPAAAVTWYGPAVISSNGVRLTGASQSAPKITFMPAATYSGSLASVLTVLNASQDALEDFYVHAPSSTGWNDIALVCTTGSGGCSQDDVTQLLLDGATGTVTDPAGGGPYPAAGLASFGMDGMVAKNVRAIFNADGYFAENGGNGSGSRSMILGGDYSSNSGVGIQFQGGFLQSYFVGAGTSIFSNTGAGVSLDRENGTVIEGAHFEHNNPAILIGSNGTQGLLIGGNLISQRNDSTAACFICGPLGPVSGAIDANYFSLDDTGTGPLNETALVDVMGEGLRIEANTEQTDAIRSLTLTNEYKIENGSLNTSVVSSYRDPSWVTSITVTNPVNDVANAWTGFWPWTTTANNFTRHILGNGGMEVDYNGSHGTLIQEDSGGLLHIGPKGGGNYLYCADATGQCHAASLFTADAGMVVTGTLNATSSLEQGGQAVVLTGANGYSSGQIAMSAGVGSHTFTVPYTVAPICTATDGTSAAAVWVTATTTAVTVHGTGSDLANWHCVPAVN